MAERLQKLIARAGICSRRAAEALLRQGRVCVNGHIAALGDSADPQLDRIEVDGSALPAAPPPVYLMLNKPRGYVTTLSDERGRPTASELVSDCGARVFPVGRLDMDSEGLLIFTNDGALMQALIHPSGEVDKVYRVAVTGEVDGAAERLSAIRSLDGERIRPAQVETLSQSGGQAVLRITIHEGKNRQIRRMCGAAGLSVESLRRIQEHTLHLGALQTGKWRYLTDTEIRDLKGSDIHGK